jgi:hypothetical protein
MEILWTPKRLLLNLHKVLCGQEKKASVKLWNNIYQTGKKRSKKTMELHEKAIDRLDDKIGKWFITFDPLKIKSTLSSV